MQKYRVRRRGVAPVEFLMFLPVLTAFIALLFWLARVQKTSLEVILQSEVKTIENSIQLQTPGALLNSSLWNGTVSNDLVQLVHGFEPTLDLKAGIAKGEDTRDTGKGVANVIAPAGDASHAHEVLSHSWNAEIFRFPNGSHEQRQLELPSCVKGIAPRLRNRRAFESLRNF